jgi:hypothetical protein
MNDEEYKEFWNKFLERYPDFNPTVQQTKDWHRELKYKDAALMEASVATVITEKSSNIPKLPWFLSAFYKIQNDRKRSSQQSNTYTDEADKDFADILVEREEHIKRLEETSLDNLRRATRTVLDKYSRLKPPLDSNVAQWDKWLRACVWQELYGNNS